MKSYEMEFMEMAKIPEKKRLVWKVLIFRSVF